MSGLDDFFRQIDEMKAKQDAKVAALRDGTDLGDLKADYLAATYQRQRLTTGLRILTDTGVPELARAEKRAEIAQVDKKLAELERRLDAKGIRVRKVRR
jgi:hypothetical protein